MRFFFFENGGAELLVVALGLSTIYVEKLGVVARNLKQYICKSLLWELSLLVIALPFLIFFFFFDAIYAT